MASGAFLPLRGAVWRRLTQRVWLAFRRKVNSDQWEFSHPNFRRGWFVLLKDIKRRKAASKEDKRSEMSRQHREDTISSLIGRDGNGDARKVENLLQDKDALISEVIKLRKQQDATQRMLAATLNELHETRCEQQRTQDTVEKVVSFLSTVVEGQAGVKGSAITAALESSLMGGSARGGDGDAPASKRAKFAIEDVMPIRSIRSFDVDNRQGEAGGGPEAELEAGPMHMPTVPLFAAPMPEMPPPG